MSKVIELYKAYGLTITKEEDGSVVVSYKSRGTKEDFGELNGAGMSDIEIALALLESLNDDVFNAMEYLNDTEEK